MKYKLTMIKIGGSVITDKKVAYQPREENISALAKVIKKAKQTLIIAHGAGSFAHVSAKKYGGKKGFSSRFGIAKVAFDASEINHIVMKIFIEEGLPAVSFRPMSLVTATEGRLRSNFFHVLDLVIQYGLIPVMFGDVVWDYTWKSTIYSGETIINKIAIYMNRMGHNIEQIIQLTDTDGVLDDRGHTIPVLHYDDWPKIKKYISRPKGADVTGGMTHKLDKSFQMTRYGIKTLIINGTKPSLLEKVLLGEKVIGTEII